jgi:hypothetical protein
VDERSSGRRERSGQAAITWLFLRTLGLIFLFAFVSLRLQVLGLAGSEGLLPAQKLLAAVPRFGMGERLLALPTVFWLDASDRTLALGATAGVLLSVLLTLDLAPRLTAFLLWALYLSFVSIGQDFFSFQWDNLLLEAGALAVFLAPGHLLPLPGGRIAAPPPIVPFLCRWLLFRLLIESGLSKLLGGDPSWRNLTAMASYFETAPLPTPLAFHAHHLPPLVLRGLGLLTLAIEIPGAFLALAPPGLRARFFPVLFAFQLAIFLTGNYGIFNPLTVALGLFLLTDRDLGWLRFLPRLRSFGLGAAESGLGHRFAAFLLAAVVLPLSVLGFIDMWRPDWVRAARLPRRITEFASSAEPFRSVNRYHLFAQMTHTREEVVIEGTRDGKTWEPYVFRWKPQDPRRPPAFVAPLHPRLDFQLWFLTLSRGPLPAYFTALVHGLCDRPAAMRRHFATDPFPLEPPVAVRIQVYRYRFATPAERRRAGVIWHRELTRSIGQVRCGGAAGSLADGRLDPSDRE